MRWGNFCFRLAIASVRLSGTFFGRDRVERRSAQLVVVSLTTYGAPMLEIRYRSYVLRQLPFTDPQRTVYLRRPRTLSLSKVAKSALHQVQSRSRAS